MAEWGRRGPVPASERFDSEGAPAGVDQLLAEPLAPQHDDDEPRFAGQGQGLGALGRGFDNDEALLGEGPEVDAVNLVGTSAAGAARRPRHHLLPQEDRPFFESRGFVGDNDIDQSTVELDTGVHGAIHGGGDWRLGRQWDGEWNTASRTAIADLEAVLGRPATREEIMDTTMALAEEYDIAEPMVPFRGDGPSDPDGGDA